MSKSIFRRGGEVSEKNTLRRKDFMEDLLSAIKPVLEKHSASIAPALIDYGEPRLWVGLSETSTHQLQWFTEFSDVFDKINTEGKNNE